MSRSRDKLYLSPTFKLDGCCIQRHHHDPLELDKLVFHASHIQHSCTNSNESGLLHSPKTDVAWLQYYYSNCSPWRLITATASLLFLFLIHLLLRTLNQSALQPPPLSLIQETADILSNSMDLSIKLYFCTQSIGFGFTHMSYLLSALPCQQP